MRRLCDLPVDRITGSRGSPEPAPAGDSGHGASLRRSALMFSAEVMEIIV
ncbi:MAG: hypothetical protein SWK76_17780 [Actinomycetota bacterium]|nr:hypothetical protein [Actinomycetota bacterium]